MSSVRWGAITGITACFLSVFLGVLFDVRIFHIILRGFIFGTVFFGFGFGLRVVINSFFPELLYNDDESITQDQGQIGSQINITLDSAGEYAVPELFKNDGDQQEMGNIEELIAGIFRPGGASESRTSAPKPSFSPIDAMREAGYNNVGGGQDDLQDLSVFQRPSAESQSAAQQQFTPAFGDGDDSGLGGLPDLDMMARAFSSASGGSSAAESMPSPSFEPMPPPPSMSSMSSMPMMAEIDSVVESARAPLSSNKPQALEGDFDPKSLAEGIRTVLSKD